MTSYYTNPKLRQQIKKRIQNGTKGGKSGQWSAIKSLILSRSYKKEMLKRQKTPFTTLKNLSTKQKALRKWVSQDWQTSSGSKYAKTRKGYYKRYLPYKKWQKMTQNQKRKTNAKKLQGSRRRRQRVNT